ncbi:P-loop NTPase [bacterium]|nr:P-loop NTPase [bacterium]
MIEEHSQETPTVIAIGSGKGGVGKSAIAAAMGAGFAMLNRKTVVMDADFGGSNLHQIMGIPRPAYTYRDFQNGRVDNLNQIVVEHHQYDNLGLIFGAAGSYGMANEKYMHRQRFLNHIRDIRAEFVILDLGAGSSFQVLDIFTAADLGIVILNPEPLSLSEGFNFVKQVVIRTFSKTLRQFPEIQTFIQEHAKTETFRSNVRVEDLILQIQQKDAEVAGRLKTCLDELQIGLVLNKVTNDEQSVEVSAFQRALQEILSINTELLGLIHLDPVVPEGLKAGVPFMAMDPKAGAARDLANLIITKVLHRNRFHAFWDRSSINKKIHEIGKPSGTRMICSVNCMYWEECGYRQGGYPCRLQHMSEIGFQGED